MDNTIFGRLSRLSLVAVITLLFCPSLKAQLDTNGYGIYEEFGAPLYAVKLETERQFKDATDLLTDQTSKRLSLRVLANSVGQRQWCRFWTQNIAINISSTDLERLAENLLRACDQVAGDLVLGDEIVFHRESERITQLRINSVPFAYLEGEGIYEAFLSPFLGNSPVSNDLKSDLLSEISENSEAAISFRQSGFAVNRVSLVESWIAPPEPEPEPLLQPETEIADLKTRKPNSALPSGDTEFAAIQPFDIGKSQASMTWSPVWQEESSVVYESSELNGEPVLASVAYLPNSYSMLDLAPSGDPPVNRPKENLTRVPLLDIQEYQARSLLRVYANIEYPSIAVRRGREGSIRLMAKIDRAGNVQQIDALETTRFDELNEAAQTAVANSAPFDAPPLASNEDFFELLLPIRFEIE
jgi:TonB family protein